MNSDVFQSIEDGMWYYYDLDNQVQGPYDTQEDALDYWERKVLRA